jgi:hypothetical protein
MKKIVLMLTVAVGLLVPTALFVGNAGASPGGGDASCGTPNAPPCNSEDLPYSEGCQNGQAPSQNPHCTPAEETTPVTATPTASSSPAGQVAGAQGQGGAANAQAAGAAQGGSGAAELPFTGLETLWLALLGAGMLGSGLALKRARSDHSG